MNIKMIDFHAADLAHFEYKGRNIPIGHHGCSNLEKATMMFRGSKGLGRVFTLVSSILQVKILGVQADMHGYEQVTWCLLFFICSSLLTSEFLNTGSNIIFFLSLSCFSCRR
jgi:hypothetical protein